MTAEMRNTFWSLRGDCVCRRGMKSQTKGRLGNSYVFEPERKSFSIARGRRKRDGEIKHIEIIRLILLLRVLLLAKTEPERWLKSVLGVVPGG